MEIENLKKVAKTIAEKIPVEKIYYLKNPNDNKSHLIIVIEASCGIKFTELEPFVKMVIDGNNNISHTFYQSAEIRDSLKKGNLIFFLACTEDTLLYNKTDSPELPQFNSDILLSWKTDAISKYKDGIIKTKSFLDGAEYFNKNKDGGLTTFMIHQFMELTFRTLELALFVKEQRTHNISLHQSAVLTFLPELCVLFPEDSPEEIELLKTLNNSYSAVRYEQNYHVDEHFIPILFERAYIFQKGADLSFEKIIHSLDIRIEAINNDKRDFHKTNSTIQESLAIEDYKTTIKPPNDISTCYGNIILKEFLNEFIKKYSPQRIIGFGCLHDFRSSIGCFAKTDIKESFHYFLVVILPNAGISLMNDMQDYANSHFENGRITILAQSWDHIVSALEKGKTFFNYALKTGTIIYKGDDDDFEEPLLPEIDHAAVLCAAEKVYKRKKELANGFLQAAEFCLSSNYTSNALFFLHQATEQACIQSIRLHIDYRCEFHNLERLLELVECFKPGLGSWFIYGIGEDKRLFKLLKESYSTSRYRTDFTADKTDVEKIYKHVVKFVSEADAISFRRLGKITQTARNAAQDLADYNPALMAT